MPRSSARMKMMFGRAASAARDSARHPNVRKRQQARRRNFWSRMTEFIARRESDYKPEMLQGVGWAAGRGTFFKYCHAIKPVMNASTAQVTYGIAGLM